MSDKGSKGQPSYWRGYSRTVTSYSQRVSAKTLLFSPSRKLKARKDDSGKSSCRSLMTSWRKIWYKSSANTSVQKQESKTVGKVRKILDEMRTLINKHTKKVKRVNG